MASSCGVVGVGPTWEGGEIVSVGVNGGGLVGLSPAGRGDVVGSGSVGSGTGGESSSVSAGGGVFGGVEEVAAAAITLICSISDGILLTVDLVLAIIFSIFDIE